MNIYYDKGKEEEARQQGDRDHPWTFSEIDENARYYNFNETPQLIETVLEDFVPYNNYKAIQTFFDLIRFTVTKDSVIETNDSTFRFGENVSKNTETVANQLYQATGRVMLFWREHFLNTISTYAWLYENLWKEIEQIDKDFELGWISFSHYETNFLSILPPWVRKGNELTIHFWAWGMTEKETFENLDRLFCNLLVAVKNVSNKAQLEQIVEKTLAHKKEREKDPQNFI